MLRIMTEFKTKHKVELWVHSAKEGFLKKAANMDDGLQWIANRYHGKAGVNLVVKPVVPVLPMAVAEKCKPGLVQRHAFAEYGKLMGKTPIE